LRYEMKINPYLPALPMTMGNTLKMRTVVKSFHVLQVGDLAAQVATQGREHMSSCRCFKCNLTAAQWKAGRTGEILTLADLCNLPNAAIGQKYYLVWNVGGNDSLTPVLQEILTLSTALLEDKERLIRINESYDLQYPHMKDNIREIKALLSQSTKRRAKIQKSNRIDKNDQILREDYNIIGYEHRLTNLQTNMKTMKKHQSDSECAVRQKTSNLATLRNAVKTCVDAWWNIARERYCEDLSELGRCNERS